MYGYVKDYYIQIQLHFAISGSFCCQQNTFYESSNHGKYKYLHSTFQLRSLGS